MIDVESEIYTYLRSGILEQHSDAYITGEHNNTPDKFPCVSITEIGNAPYRRTSDSSTIENHTSVTYEVSVYSNLVKGRKSEARSIMSTVDGLLSEIGFTRMMLEPVPNIADASIYRIIGRYRAVIGTDSTIYRR